jgi:hypothetical protein
VWESQLDQLAEEQIAPLVRKEDLGSVLNFEQAVGKLRTLRTIAATSAPSLEFAPSGAINDISEALKTAIEEKGRMAGFNPAANDAATTRDGINRRIENALDQAKRAGAQLMGIRGGLDVDERVGKLDDVLKDVEAKAASIDAIYRDAQPKAIDIGGERLATYYETQTGAYGAQAQRFLVAGVLAAIWIAGVAINPFHVLGPDISAVDPAAPGAWLEAAIALGPRVVLAAIGVYVLRFASRQYGANRHLEAVNVHRKNALETLRLYSEGAPDPNAQAIVLTAVAGAIFRDPETGFLGSPGESRFDLPGGWSISSKD